MKENELTTINKNVEKISLDLIQMMKIENIEEGK